MVFSFTRAPLEQSKLRAACYFADGEPEKGTQDVHLAMLREGRTLFVHRCIECHTLPVLWRYRTRRLARHRRQHVASRESETGGARSNRRLHSRCAIR